MASTRPPLGPYTSGAGRFSMAIGMMMILMWGWLLPSGAWAEIQARPLGTGLHVLGEILTGFALIVAGWGLLNRAKWARPLHILATGMLIIAIIHAVGWYAARGLGIVSIAFVVLAVVAVFFAIRAEE